MQTIPSAIPEAPSAAPDSFATQEGGPVTVQGFLADVQAIKEGRAPTNVSIGLRFTEY